MGHHTTKTLISAEDIETRITEIASELNSRFSNKELLVIGILNGSILFLADLIRKLKMPIKIDMVGISSYGNSTTSGQLEWTKELSESPANQNVLIVEDILETGKTLQAVIEHVQSFKPRQLYSCVLLSKKCEKTFPIKPEFECFEIGDEFVVGYGLDYAGNFRNLPYIGILEEKSESSHTSSELTGNDLMIRIQFWSFYRDLVESDSADVVVTEKTSLEDIKNLIGQTWPQLQDHMNSMLIAVNNDYYEMSHVPRDGDIISLFPPVQGG